MSSSLKSRVKRLEDGGSTKEVPGIIIYFENAVDKENEKGISEIVSADYYLVNDDEGEPLSDDELEKALDGKTYITYLPVQDKKEDIDWHVIETDTQ